MNLMERHSAEEVHGVFGRCVAQFHVRTRPVVTGGVFTTTCEFAETRFHLR